MLPEKILHKAQLLGVDLRDINEMFVRGSGKGGQKINKTSSTVLLRHLPTGIEVRCQKHREQSKNRISAYKLLLDKIEFLQKGKESAKAKKIFKLRKQKKRRSKKAKEKILEMKKLHSQLKESRKNVTDLT